MPEVLDGLAGVGPQLLGQHRQAERAGIARRARDRVDRAERLCRHTQRDDAPAAGRLSGSSGLERAEREQLRRAQDVAAVGQLNGAPLPTTRERNLRLRGLAVAWKGRLERLQGGVRARKRRSESSESARQGVLADTGGRSERGDAEACLGQGSGLVEADRVGRGERLDGVELLRQRAASGELQGSREINEAGQEDQPLRDDVDRAGDDGRESLVEGRLAEPEAQGEETDEGRRHRNEDHDQSVEAYLERRRRVTERPRLAGEALGIALGSDGGDDVGARALDGKGARQHLLADGSADRLRLAGQDRFVDAKRLGRHYLAVGDDLVARLDENEVAPDHLTDVELPPAAVANDLRGRLHQRRELLQRALGPDLLDASDQRVRDDDAEEDRVRRLAERHGEDAEEPENGVREREDVVADDARVGAACRRLAHRTALGQAPLRFRFGEPGSNRFDVGGPGHRLA